MVLKVLHETSGRRRLTGSGGADVAVRRSATAASRSPDRAAVSRVFAGRHLFSCRRLRRPTDRSDKEQLCAFFEYDDCVISTVPIVLLVLKPCISCTTNDAM
ncbi:hypothetical protein EVAR_21327_1 [Eumeta japonica]|uniref:Uncharacterized protein n=1 Tax=Eumeta variegata TaxID=151549 RepID=A0A4C1ZT56_EUMVA|nr:hypothetical protein EVAR_21327_1 [Eumeta japonica]